MIKTPKIIQTRKVDPDTYARELEQDLNKQPSYYTREEAKAKAGKARESASGTNMQAEIRDVVDEHGRVVQKHFSVGTASPVSRYQSPSGWHLGYLLGLSEETRPYKGLDLLGKHFFMQPEFFSPLYSQLPKSIDAAAVSHDYTDSLFGLVGRLYLACEPIVYTPFGAPLRWLVNTETIRCFAQGELDVLVDLLNQNPGNKKIAQSLFDSYGNQTLLSSYNIKFEEAICVREALDCFIGHETTSIDVGKRIGKAYALGEALAKYLIARK